jgi:predicted secreted acid phosphatase
MIIASHNPIALFFLSGRPDKLYDATVENLMLHGYTTFDRVILRSVDEGNGLSAAKYKAAKRASLVKEGFAIVGCVGDQESDFEGSYTGYKVNIPNYTHILK